jgi:hypothetical protein
MSIPDVDIESLLILPYPIGVSHQSPIREYGRFHPANPSKSVRTLITVAARMDFGRLTTTTTG